MRRRRKVWAAFDLVPFQWLSVAFFCHVKIEEDEAGCAMVTGFVDLETHEIGRAHV